MRYAVYSVATGQIQRLVNREDQAREGEATVELPEAFDGNDTTHEVIDGEVVEKP